MPVKQQYFIAAAIIALIAVMAIFAMFDYFSDQSRYAERMTVAPVGQAAPAAMPYMGTGNARGIANMLGCGTCGWRGMGFPNSACPSCNSFLSNLGSGLPPVNAQNAGFFDFFSRETAQSGQPRGALYCPTCNFAMTSKHKAVPNSIRCPRCPSYLMISGMGTSAATGRQANPGGW